MSRHRTQVSADDVTRAEIEGAVFAELDRMVVTVGELVDRFAAEADWQDWVERRLPFTVDEARRMRAVALASRLLQAEALANAPRPWRAIWVMPHGRIGKGMPTAASHTRQFTAGDLFAGRLMDGKPEQLSDDVLASLRRWLD